MPKEEDLAAQMQNQKLEIFTKVQPNHCHVVRTASAEVQNCSIWPLSQSLNQHQDNPTMRSMHTYTKEYDHGI